jgi:hypothetical protein
MKAPGQKGAIGNVIDAFHAPDIHLESLSIKSTCLPHRNHPSAPSDFQWSVDDCRKPPTRA